MRVLGSAAAMMGLAGLCAAQSALITVTGGGFNENLGQAVAAAGDVNSDNWPDVLIGVPGEDTNGIGAGQALVVAGPIGASVLHNFIGDAADDRFGTALAGVGDIDLDGYDEVAVGAPGHTTGTGLVRVFSGRTGLVVREHTGAAPGDRFGSSLVNVGDVDADGWPDYAVGSPGESGDTGAVRVYSALTGGLLHTFPGDAAGDRLGTALTGAGDLDLDGYADVFAGAPGAAGSTGYARAYSGQGGAVLFTFAGQVAGDQLGESVAAADDLDADGRPELLVSAPGDSHAGYLSGRVEIRSGRTGARRYTFFGELPSNAFGEAVANAGDVDGDGVSDILVGYWRGSVNGSFSGTTRLYSGRTLELALEMHGSDAGRFGFAIAGAGDVDVDGYADVIVGAPMVDTGVGLDMQNVGRAFVFAGAPFAVTEPGAAMCFGDGSGNPCPCGNASPTSGEGCQHSGGFGMQISAGGTARISSDDLALTVTGAPINNFGFFYAGRTGKPAGDLVFDGLQCTGGDVRRFQSLFQTSGTVSDTGFVAQDPSGSYFVPGAPYVFQYWSQDGAGGPCGGPGNFSPAYRVLMTP